MNARRQEMALKVCNVADMEQNVKILLQATTQK